jgi:hypothetical protein
MTRFLHVLVAFATFAVLAGCGGGDGGSGSATGDDSPATIVPANVPIYVSVNTDFDSEQLKQADELLDKFPGRQELMGELMKEIEREGVDWDKDVKPAIGDELAFVVLDFEGENFVVLLKPKDRAKLEELAEKEDDDETVLGEHEGWTVIAETQQVIDRFKREAASGDKLVDEAAFEEAMGPLPEEAIAKAYVDGQAVAAELGELAETQEIPGFDVKDLEWVSGAVEARDEGFAMEFNAKGAGSTGETYEAKLLEEVPAGVLAVVSFNNAAANFDQLRNNREVRKGLQQFETMTGVKVDDILELLRGEGAIYVRPGSPLPEFTGVLEVEDEQDAMRTLDKLVDAAAEGLEAETRETDIDGVKVRELQIEGVTILYGAFDGKVVITNARAAFRDLRGDGDKLADDDEFNSALEDAGMPDDTAGFVYVNIKDAVAVVEGFLQLADEPIPPKARENLRPLRSFVAWGANEDGASSVTMVLGIE